MVPFFYRSSRFILKKLVGSFHFGLHVEPSLYRISAAFPFPSGAKHHWLSSIMLALHLLAAGHQNKRTPQAPMRPQSAGLCRRNLFAAHPPRFSRRQREKIPRGVLNDRNPHFIFAPASIKPAYSQKRQAPRANNHRLVARQRSQARA
mgnify:CR=1 FL=1